MMNNLIRFATTTIAAGVIAFGVAAPANAAEPEGVAIPTAARPPCPDSNGARLGGSVYVRYGVMLRCDVSPPQRLHETQVPSPAACANAGGHGWTRTTRICWDIDY